MLVRQSCEGKMVGGLLGVPLIFSQNMAMGSPMS
jgi:hypothetical protein